MSDYLKELCDKRNVKLVYTKNKYIIMSCSTQNNIPTIRVHNIFEDCSYEVANAIIEYFTDFKNNDASLRTIDDYVSNNFSFDKYKIKGPDKNFKEIFINELKPPNPKDDSELVEFKIISIDKKDFYDDAHTILDKEPFEISSEDVTELDITVDFLNT